MTHTIDQNESNDIYYLREGGEFHHNIIGVAVMLKLQAGSDC